MTFISKTAILVEPLFDTEGYFKPFHIDDEYNPNVFCAARIVAVSPVLECSPRFTSNPSMVGGFIETGPFADKNEWMLIPQWDHGLQAGDTIRVRLCDISGMQQVEFDGVRCVFISPDDVLWKYQGDGIVPLMDGVLIKPIREEVYGIESVCNSGIAVEVGKTRTGFNLGLDVGDMVYHKAKDGQKHIHPIHGEVSFIPYSAIFARS